MAEMQRTTPATGLTLRIPRAIGCALLFALVSVAPAAAQECPEGSEMVRQETGEGEIRIFCQCVPGRVLKGNSCVIEAKKDPACIRQCGLDLQDDLDVCKAHGRDALVDCGAEVAAASCIVSCLAGSLGAGLPGCAIACAAGTTVGTWACALKAGDQFGDCSAATLKLDKSCRETC